MDFLSYVASFFPHLFVDASRDFSSGSSLFLSALRSLASAPPSAPPPSGAPVIPPVSLPLPAASLSVPAAPLSVLLRPSFSSSFPHPPVSTPVLSAPPLGFSTPAVRPPPGLSASAVSSFPSFAQSVSLAAPSPAPSAPCGFSLLPSAPVFLRMAAPAVPVAAPAVPVAAPAVPVAPAPIFRPFAVSGSSEPPVLSLTPFPPVCCSWCGSRSCV